MSKPEVPFIVSNKDNAFFISMLRDANGAAAALTMAKARGIAERHFESSYAPVWTYVIDFFKKYNGMPSLQQVVEQTKMILGQEPGGPFAFCLEELVKKRVLDILNKANAKEAAALASLDLDGARMAARERDQLLRQEELAGARAERFGEGGEEVLAYYERIEPGQYGIPVPFPSLQEATMGMWPGDVGLIIARPATGKCVAFDTRLTHPVTGVPVTIEQVVNDPTIGHVHSWSKAQGLHVAPITAKVDTGSKECLEFTLRSGRRVTVTPEHPFLTPGGWRRADQVKVKGAVAVPSRIPDPTSPVRMLDAEVDLLAILLSEGNYTHDRTGFSTVDRDLLQIATVAAEALGAKVHHRGGCDYDFVGPGGGRKNPVRELVRTRCVDFALSKAKVIPDCVYGLPRDQLARFLAVFWMCDGGVEVAGPEMTLASEELVTGIQHLLLRFGVQSGKKYKKASYLPSEGERRWFDAWRLTVYAPFWKTFADSLPLWGTKRAKLLSMLENSNGHSNVGYPAVDEDFVKGLRASVKQGTRGRPGVLSRVGGKLGWSSSFSFRNLFTHGSNRHLAMPAFRALCEEAGWEEQYGWLWASDLFWDQVVKIESVGVKKIYDLTVSSTSCFVANDIIVHNTFSAILFAICAWKAGYRVLFVTTEMAKLSIRLRFYAMLKKISYNRLRKARLTAQQKEELKEFWRGEFARDERFMLIGGQFDSQVETLDAHMDSFRPQLVVIDGAYLMRIAGNGKLTPVENDKLVMNELKRLAARYEAAMVATTQYNRNAAGGKKGAHDTANISGTDAAGWNATWAFGMSRTPEQKLDNQMRFNELKMREGICGDFDATWNFDTMTFEEIPRASIEAPVVDYGTGFDVPPMVGTGAPPPPGGDAPPAESGEF